MKSSLAYTLAGLTLAGTLAAPKTSHACGGFFCQSVPIDQSAEQILFSIDDNHVTAHVQISYQGNAEDFAWVVPVMTPPVLSVGTPALFQTLTNQTGPSYSINWSPDLQNCFSNVAFSSSGSFDAGAVSTADAGASPGVVILESREVGPYNTVTLSAQDPKALVTWLNTNGYAQPPSATPAIEHYVKQGMTFVALKLKRGASTGDIRPLVMDMDQGEACVPLILTRVAAVPDMPIRIFVLSNARAVPRNWFHVELDQRRIDWFRGGSNYNQLATEAINNAAGHGFITEYAGDTPQNFTIPKGESIDALAQITDARTLLMRVLEMPWPSATQSELLPLFEKYVPVPPVATQAGIAGAFYYQPWALQQYPPAADVDAAAFTAELIASIWIPLQRAQSLLRSKPYLTRMFTTVSPDEMNRDPFFHMNAALPPVNNNHTANATGTCIDGMVHDGVITVENGERVRMAAPFFRFNPPPWQAGATLPAARHISLVGPTGKPAFFSAHQALVADGLLDTQSPDAVRATPIPAEGSARPSVRAPSNLDNVPPGNYVPTEIIDDPNAPLATRDDDGCAFGGTPATSGGAWCLLALALLRVRKKRKTA